MEAAGIVEEVGEGVDGLKPGDRVAYAGYKPGAYAQARIMPAERLVSLPDFIEDQQAAAMMLQGMTVEYLIRRTFSVQEGQTVLFHAIAGGVGLLARRRTLPLPLGGLRLDSVRPAPNAS